MSANERKEFSYPNDDWFEKYYKDLNLSSYDKKNIQKEYRKECLLGILIGFIKRILSRLVDIFRGKIRPVDQNLIDLMDDLAAFARLKSSVKREACVHNASQEAEEYFFHFVQYALLDAWRLHFPTKRKAWSLWRNCFIFLCQALVSAAVVFCSAILENYFDGIVSNARFIVGVSLIGLILAYICYKWQDLRSYRETWVRHSACYYRLRLALSSFLSSSRSWTDYQRFKEQIYSISNQNLDQFVLNLSGHGLASRSTGSTSSTEKKT